jgi:hypothetical protein
VALDSEAAAMWMVERARADATLDTILGATVSLKKVHRDPIPASIALPGIAVGVQASGPRTGAIRSGPNTHTATVVTLRSTIMDTGNLVKVKQAADRMDLLFDGVFYQATAYVYIWSCVRMPGEVTRHRTENGITTQYVDVFWEVVAKAT